MSTLTFAFVSHSEVGLVRKNNQDSGYASDTLLLVCDGMGGAAAGDLASSVAATIVSRIDEQTFSDTDAVEAAAALALEEANATLLDLVSHDPALNGMGTTVSGALLHQDALCIVHVGDSRAYRLRDGELTQLTHDHSLVQSLIDQGKITDEDAKIHPHRSLLLKVLNGSPQHTPDIWSEEARPGDRLLVCSDGLCGMVEHDVLDELVRIEDRDEALRKLTAAAYDGGGLDNITILLGDVVDDEHEPVPGAFLGAASEVDIPDYSGDLHGAHEQVAPTPKPAAKKPPRAHHVWRWLLVSLTTLALLFAGAFGAHAYLRNQFYVGGTPDGYVAIYKGIPDRVLGIDLNRVADDSFRIRMDSLPTSYQDKLANHLWRGETRDQAYETVHQLMLVSIQCQAQKDKRAQDPSQGPAVDGC